jgi:anaerobic magnesium-protoporphyrin IX monomethyl ester cyclase
VAAPDGAAERATIMPRLTRDPPRQAPRRTGSRRTGRPVSACLVHTPCLELRDDRLEPPLGLLYVATSLNAHGHRTELCDLSALDEPDLDRRIPDGRDLYGFSTYSVNYGQTLALMRAAKRRNPRALFVAGGPHATALPRAVAADGFDLVVTGEAERTMVEVAAEVGRGGRPAGIVDGVPPAPLDDLPFPDRDLIDLAYYSRQVDGQQCVSLLASRGCPYRCTFCNSNIMGAGKPMRYRSPENVVAEIREVGRRYGIRHFRFQDDIFTIHRRRVEELTAALAAERIVYRCFARINTCAEHPDVPQMLRASGCVHASFGVESGSPRILALAAMYKSQTPDQIRRGLVHAWRAGLRSRIFLIVGYPGETDATIAETLALVKDCPWEEFSVYPLIAYPGTPLHDRPADFGITHIDTSYSDYLQIGRNFKAGFTIRTATFDEHQVRRWRDRVIAELLADGRTWAGNSAAFQ